MNFINITGETERLGMSYISVNLHNLLNLGGRE